MAHCAPPDAKVAPQLLPKPGPPKVGLPGSPPKPDAPRLAAPRLAPSSVACTGNKKFRRFFVF